MVKLCAGSLALSQLLRDVTPGEALRVLRAAYEGGATFVDTAEYYANYDLLAAALREMPGLSVVTKTYAFDERGAKASLDKARTELGRAFIDMFLLHEQEGEHTLRGHEGACAFFRRAAEEGLVGRFGISTHRVKGVRDAVRLREKYGLGCVMAPLNVAGVGLSDGTQGDMIAALRSAKDAGLTVILMKALAGGHLISRRDEAFKFILGQDYADLCAVGMASEAEARYACAVFRGDKPNFADAAATMAADRRLVIEKGCVGCGACALRCGQGAIVMEGGAARALPGKCVRCGYCAAVCPELVIKIV